MSKRRKGQFKPGYDPRRRRGFTKEECRKGGLITARKFTVCGRWHTNWWDRCAAKRKGEY
jgi:hypothetical protein